MHNDGNLWEQFHNALKSKTTPAVKIIWTKGHAKQVHIDSGITTLKNKIGMHSDCLKILSQHEISSSTSFKVSPLVRTKTIGLRRSASL